MTSPSRSSTSPTRWAPTTIIRDARSQLDAVRQQLGKDIALIGSSDLAASLLGAGLLDELRIMINPVVLGSGRPVLAGAGQTTLDLARTRQFGSGNMLLVYRPSR